MTRRTLALLLLLLAPAGCRQADGPTPAPTVDQNNEIGDIARDMINVVNKDPQAAEDLRSDMSKYGPTDEATAHINELAKQVAQALNEARLDDATAQRLATTLWTGLTARELSRRQIEALEKELVAVLASAGVAEERAQPIADRLGDVQEAITNNPKRWYQVF
jgi:hypothetical protein